MERDIDMRQTVEEAAKEYYEGNNYAPLVFTIMNDLKISYDKVDVESIRKHHLKKGFMAGAEWQAKQSPWVSAKDKLPDDEDLVITGCWCTDYFKYLQQGWYCIECNEWHDTNGDEICVTHWMPIPDLEE